MLFDWEDIIFPSGRYMLSYDHPNARAKSQWKSSCRYHSDSLSIHLSEIPLNMLKFDSLNCWTLSSDLGNAWLGACSSFRLGDLRCLSYSSLIHVLVLWGSFFNLSVDYRSCCNEVFSSFSWWPLNLNQPEKRFTRFSLVDTFTLFLHLLKNQGSHLSTCRRCLLGGLECLANTFLALVFISFVIEVSPEDIYVSASKSHIL